MWSKLYPFIPSIVHTIHTVQVGQYRVRYQEFHSGEDGKAGEAVVLIHGLSGSTLWWRHNVSVLAQHYTLYLIDLPGFGSARLRYGHFVLKQAADWLLAWMDAIGLKQAHLIGHSMGGYICMEIAARHPEYVRRLVLVDPAFKARAQRVLGYAIPLLQALRTLRPSFLPILLYDSLRAGPRTLLSTTKDIIAIDASEDIAHITHPVLIIWGENDTLVSPLLGHQLRSELPNAHLLILKHAAHVSMFDQPQKFNAAVDAFLHGEMVGE